MLQSGGYDLPPAEKIETVPLFLSVQAAVCIGAVGMDAKIPQTRPTVGSPPPTPEFQSFPTVTARPVAWRWGDLIFSLCLAGALVGSWLWPRGRVVWDQVDETIYGFGNALVGFEPIQNALAMLNHRHFDMVGIALYALVLVYATVAGKRCWRRSVISASLLALLLLSVKGVYSLGLHQFEERFERASPTVVHADALRISELKPEIPCKDASCWCFPSDHAFFALGILIYLGYRGPDLAVWLSTVLALLYILPRLVVGAHWFSDVAVGSAAYALAGTSLLMATPLHQWGVNLLDWKHRQKPEATAQRLARRARRRMKSVSTEGLSEAA